MGIVAKHDEAANCPVFGGGAEQLACLDIRSAASRRPGAEIVRCRDELLLRRAAIDAALEGLASYEFGPGYAHGLREYWRKRHETEQPAR